MPKVRVASSPPVAPLSAIAGVLFVAYAFTKGPLTTTIVASGWQFAGLSPEATALVVHVAESVPIAVMAMGLSLLWRRAGTRGPLASAGYTVAVAGFGLTVLSHVAEHIFEPVTVPAITGGENLLVWGYYLSWMTLYVGLATYGVALERAETTPGWIPGLFVGSLPAVVVVGYAVVFFDLFTLAGTFRVVQGATWLLVGGWLWRGTSTR